MSGQDAVENRRARVAGVLVVSFVLQVFRKEGGHECFDVDEGLGCRALRSWR